METRLDLIIPVYLDTNALLDLLASIEGGFSLVEKVSSRTTAMGRVEKEGAVEGGTEFGIPNVLSLLKVRMTGALRSAKQREEGEEVVADRYHTYGSLLFRLVGISNRMALRSDQEQGPNGPRYNPPTSWKSMVSFDQIRWRTISSG